MAGRPIKHHYIPVFYLKRWVGVDGRLCEYSKPWGNIVRPKRVHPDGTGYQRRLNTIEGLPESEAHQLEERFFAPVDRLAADALKVLESDFRWDADTRSGWSRFIVSLLLRPPEELHLYQEYFNDILRDASPDDEAHYQAVRQAGDPPTFAEWVALELPGHLAATSAARALSRLIDGKEIGQRINDMRWLSMKVYSNYEFLTSDRPVLITNGLNRPDAAILMPIGPRRLFFAANDPSAGDKLRALSPDAIVTDVNKAVAGQAVRFIYGRDDRQLRFVQNRMGATPMRSIAGAQLEERRRQRSQQTLQYTDTGDS